MSALDVVLADGWRYSGAISDARAELERMRDDISDMKTAMQAERLRGDTYRRRALALRRQAKAWRNTSEYNLEEARFYLEEFNALVSADEA